MSFIINTNFEVRFPIPIDGRLIVESVDGLTPSLVSLQVPYNYENMIVWVRDEKAFYYLKDSPSEFGATASDWIKFSGGATGGCAKSGYVSGTSFTGLGPSTASVVFGTPYESASYSVAITGELTSQDPTVYSILDKTASGFIIQAEAGGPLGATAMWITNCWDGSGLSSGGAAGAQGPTGPGGSTADTAGRRGWESGQSFSTPSGGYTLTASSTASTIFFPISNSFDSPQGDIVVTLDPNLAISDINRNFRLVVDNLQRIESGSTWSIVAPMEGFDSGDRILEWSEGRIEPQVLEFVWNDSARSGLGGYEMFRYLAEPFVRNNLSGSASSRDFTTTKRQTGFFGGNATETVSSSGSSTVYPAGSILFIKEAFVTCEGNTTTGVTVSFGLRESDQSTIATSEFTPDLTTFGISSTDQIIFPNKSLNDFATGSVFYSDSPVGVVRINRPMMIYMRLTGGSLEPGTFLKCVVPYIVDEFSLTVASGLGGQIASSNQSTGAGFAIDLEEIAFGTGTGITSSNLFTFDQSNTNLILGNSDFISDPSYYSAHIGGYNNKITAGKSSVILGSTGSGIVSSSKSTFAYSATIIGSHNVCSRGSNYSSLINNFNTEICGSTASVIIGSKNALLKDSLYSSILNTKTEDSTAGILNSKYSTSISSCLTKNQFAIKNSCHSISISNYNSSICDSKHSSILSSYQVSIKNSAHSAIIGMYNGGIKNSSFSINIGGANNCIDNTGVPESSHYGGIVFGSGNKICNAIQTNSIFSGEKNLISGSFDTRSNVIISGRCNTMFGNSKYSSIIGGFTNSMTASYHSSIIGGYCNKICGDFGISTVPVSYSSILGGYKNRIISKFKSGQSENSAIIGGCNNSISFAENSVIIGGKNLSITYGPSVLGTFPDVVYVPSLKGHGSLQLQVTTSSTDIFLDHTNFTLIAYPPVSGMTVSLPRADDAPNRIYIIKKNGSSTQSVVYISPNGSDTIDGYSDSIELINPWDYNILQSDGVNLWIKLGGAVGLNL